MTDDYKDALAQAKANLQDAIQRGIEDFPKWSDIKKELFTPEELAASDLRVSRMTGFDDAKSQATG